jgi:hypothetical protein
MIQNTANVVILGLLTTRYRDQTVVDAVSVDRNVIVDDGVAEYHFSKAQKPSF